MAQERAKANGVYLGTARMAGEIRPLRGPERAQVNAIGAKVRTNTLTRNAKYKIVPAGGLFLLGLLLLAAPPPAAAYPQFQQCAQQHSGRNTDCAMCHRNHDGPKGVRPGQLGALTPAQKVRYDREQMALEAGQHVDSPILNDFGDQIIEALGRVKFIELSSHPEQLAPALGFAGDLDGDGLPDAREYLDGTQPLDAQSGAPGRLFWINLNRQRFTIFMTLLVTIFGIYGINNLFGGFSRLAEATRREKESSN